VANLVSVFKNISIKLIYCGITLVVVIL